MSHKVPYMLKKIPIIFSVRRKTVLVFKDKTKHHGLDKNELIEQFMLEFIKNH